MSTQRGLINTGGLEMTAKRILLVLAAFITVSVSSAKAGVLMTPAGLSTGDMYHLAFVTQGFLTNANSTSIATYDAFVQNEANRSGSITAPLGLNWKVIGSTATVDAIDHIAVSGPVYLVDFTTKIADDEADLWDNTIDNPLSLDQFGNTAADFPFPASAPWTGTIGNGTGNPGSELGAAVQVAAGSTSVSLNQGWVFTSTSPTGNTRPLYAISEKITVNGVNGNGEVPEPTSLAAWICVVGIGLVGARRRRKDRCAKSPTA